MMLVFFRNCAAVGFVHPAGEPIYRQKINCRLVISEGFTAKF